MREAREQPLLLIFEDLHWIDGETQALLDALVDSLGSARLLLLVNYRAEYQQAWGSKTSGTTDTHETERSVLAGPIMAATNGARITRRCRRKEVTHEGHSRRAA